MQPVYVLDYLNFQSFETHIKNVVVDDGECLEKLFKETRGNNRNRLRAIFSLTERALQGYRISGIAFLDQDFRVYIKPGYLRNNSNLIQNNGH